MSEEDMNEFIIDFDEYSTGYLKTTCDYYGDYLRNYQKEKIQLQNNWNELKKFLEEEIKEHEIWLETKMVYAYKDVLEKMQELEGNNE